ncbi:MAG: HEAT repeat domain-containing protein [Polyangia bacterium]
MRTARCSAVPGLAGRAARAARLGGRLVLGVLCLAAACNEPNPDLRSPVQLYTQGHGEVQERAFLQLARHGRRALPPLEAALHVSDAAGRRSVVRALQRLEFPETAALLGHLAAFDSDESVRAAAYRVLREWAAVASPLQAPAAAAVRKADEVRTN